MADDGVYREGGVVPELDRSILVAAINGNVIGIERETGVIRWSRGLPGWIQGEVFIALRYGLVVASGEGDGIFALDYQTGVPRWSKPTSAMGRATIVMESDLIVCAKGGVVDCFDHHGMLRWSRPLSGALWTGRTALGFPGNVAQADESR